MRSMTGYGSAEGKVGRGMIFVEIRTVNHRYCDLQLKIPPKMGVLDPKIRKLMQGSVERGKVDLFMKEKVGLEPTMHLDINEAAVKQYLACLRKLSKALGQKIPTDLLSVVPLKDLLVVKEAHLAYEPLWAQIRPLIQKAVSKLNQMRDAEGRHLQQDQIKRLARIEAIVKLVQKQSGIALTQHVERAKNRKENAGVMDEVRFQNDVSSMADRIDIAEEITRLRSHLVQYRGTLKNKGSIGRQLDFLLQEMNREVNTIGSKALNANISMWVVEAKAELEKLREQAQNIE